MMIEPTSWKKIRALRLSDGTISTLGYDFGRIIENYRKGQYAIWNAPGRLERLGAYGRDYCPSNWYIVKILEESKDQFTVDFIYEAQPGRYWAEALKQMEEKINELNS